MRSPKFTPVFILVALGLVTFGLSACSPSVPDSGQGVGFTDYNTYLRQQAALKAQPMAPVTTGIDTTTGFSPLAAAAAIDKAQGVTGQGVTGAAQTTGFAQGSTVVQGNAIQQGQIIGAAPIVAQTTIVQQAAPQQVSAAQPVLDDGLGLRGVTPTGIKELTVNYATDTAGVSNEQDFDAVSASRSIEGDKAQIERNKAQYKIDQPTSVPQRPGNVGPSIVEYALATQHPVGVKLFGRSPFRFKNPQVACANYDTEDSAQEAFLAAGGPNRDRLGLDPDGDGFACGWDPSPFRAVAQ